MFAGHRTYYLREHWIYKGLAALCQAEVEGRVDNVFLRPDAAEQFGIGPAMVHAVQFWLLACGLIAFPSRQERASCGRSPHLTDFGRLLWRYDPYLEQLETVWLLHSHLVKNRVNAPTWFWFFHSFVSSRPFDEPTCLDALHSWVIASYSERIPQRKTLHKDLLCLLRLYDSARQATSPEDGTASPFARLCLLSYTHDGRTRRYRLLPPDPDRLHPLILLFVLMSQQVRTGRSSSFVSLMDVFYEPGNAGRIFPLLTRNMLLDILVRLGVMAKEWSVGLIRDAGQEWLALPSCSPEQVLCRYYQKGVSL